MRADYRAKTGLQLRAEGGLKGRTVYGTWAAYNIVNVIDDWFQEMMLPGCFAESIQLGYCPQMNNSPIKCLYQHNAENVLGNMKYNTYRLVERADDLYGEVDLPKHAFGEQIREQIERGDTEEASMGFYPTATEWVQGVDMDMIKIVKANIKEGSIANFPKTSQTGLGLRAISQIPSDEKPVVLRAINRFRNGAVLSPSDRDKEILCHYRSVIEPAADEELVEILRKALPPVQQIIPVETMRAYLDSLSKKY